MSEPDWNEEFKSLDNTALAPILSWIDGMWRGLHDVPDSNKAEIIVPIITHLMDRTWDELG